MADDTDELKDSSAKLRQRRLAAGHIERSPRRDAFEQWYVENAFDLKAQPIGSRDCGLQWAAWKGGQEALTAEKPAWPAVDGFGIAQRVCRDVAELGDRTSPEGWPEAMLVTHEELHGIVLDSLAALTMSRAEVAEFEAAMAEAGFPQPNPRLYRRDFDRLQGWNLARARSAANKGAPPCP